MILSDILSCVIRSYPKAPEKVCLAQTDEGDVVVGLHGQRSRRSADQCHFSEAQSFVYPDDFFVHLDDSEALLENFVRLADADHDSGQHDVELVSFLVLSEDVLVVGELLDGESLGDFDEVVLGGLRIFFSVLEVVLELRDCRLRSGG